MNLTLLLEGHGQICVKEFRCLEALERKRARFQNHLRFTLHCREEGVVPSSLGIKNPIPTKNAEMIVRKARMALVKERIRCTVNKINNIEVDMEKKRREFKQLFPLEKETEKAMNEHLKRVGESEFQITKRHHIRKFAMLTSAKNKEHDTTKTNSKWVCNLSKCQLSDTEQ